ncbi:hypothetical protein H5410_033843 [Solanum commersonii]|uniref:Uncharacterized protein n=1 Tax=Solanum commersonii TaxID=4109 RepID=A0A9J5YPS4_SOLCO|nr:hypothetical protein H5410_033843 [Solanum commersonii]
MQERRLTEEETDWRATRRIEGEIGNITESYIVIPQAGDQLICFLIVPDLTNEEKEMVRGFFEESEVLRCLKLCATVKTPGPYGFTVGLFIKCLGDFEPRHHADLSEFS